MTPKWSLKPPTWLYRQDFAKFSLKRHYNGYVKDKVFVSPLPVDLAELKQRITTAIDGLDSDTLTRIWVEMDYRLNVYRVTKGSHQQKQILLLIKL
ncbi:hypothetical protein TNCV_1885721 [Trichonephila clavipes]|nr:hypothetical protein TNCV_1885721 [Trichonephila clavipes]